MIDKICETIAVHVPYTVDEITDLYIQYKSIDKIMGIIDAAMQQQCPLTEVSQDLTQKQSDTKREEVKDVDENFKKRWLKKKQRGIGVQDIRFRFGKD